MKAESVAHFESIVLKYKIHILTIISLLFCQSINADVRTEVATNGGYTGNILGDSSELEDSYSSIRAAVDFYPAPKVELNVNSDYTYYGKFFNLSILGGGAGIKYIPTKKNSRLAILLSAKAAINKYRQSFDAFNNKNYDAGVSIGYTAGDGFYLRLGAAYNSLLYTNFDGADKNVAKFFGGMNFTLPGSNSLDIETGFAVMGYRRFPDRLNNPDSSILRPDPFDKSQTQEEYVRSLLVKDNLHSFYVSPRISRSIGPKTGINITYTYRKFTGFADKIVNGLSTGFLSPWASVYDGQSISISIKTYLLKGFTSNAGMGYWDKRFFRTMEGDDAWMIKAKYRKDYQSKYYLSFQRPFQMSSGVAAEPALQLNYTHNNSTLTLYKYSSLQISAGITFRM